MIEEFKKDTLFINRNGKGERNMYVRQFHSNAHTNLYYSNADTKKNRNHKSLPVRYILIPHIRDTYLFREFESQETQQCYYYNS